MVSFRNAYKTLISALSLQDIPSIKDNDTERQRMDRWCLDVAKYGTQSWTTRPSPRSAKFYIALGQIYMQQERIKDALEVYKHGICAIPPNDVHISQFRKEVDVILVLLARYNRQLGLIPYEVWERIFRYLDFDSYVAGSSAFSMLSSVIYDMPDFWKKLCDSNEILIRDEKVSELDITYDKPSGLVILEDKLLMLATWKRNTFRTLTFHCDYTNEGGCNVDQASLTELLRYINPSFNEVIFDKVYFHVQDIIPILESCSRVERISFTGASLDFNGYCSTLRRGVEFSCLTYLLLSFSRSAYWDEQADEMLAPVAQVIRQCPKLQHLLLANSIHPFQKDCVKQAIDYCPLLETLVVSGHGSIPKYIIDNIDHRIQSSTFASTTKGLHTFIHRSEKTEAGYDDVSAILANAYGSLEYMRLVYDGKWINNTALSPIVTHGIPNLRELHLSAYDQRVIEYTDLPIDLMLISIIPQCPKLEVLSVDFARLYLTGYLTAQDELLMTIGKSCPLLRRLSLKINHLCREKTMSSFANTIGPHFHYLCVHMSDLAVAIISQKIEQLTRCPAKIERHPFLSYGANCDVVWADVNER